MKAALKPFFLLHLMAILVLVFGCSSIPKGTGTGTGGPFTISVTVSGLAGTGLVLQDNGKDTLTITANGTFPFP